MQGQSKIQRGVLKRMLRVYSLMSAEDHVALVELALADEVVLEILYQRVMERVEAFSKSNSLVTTTRSLDGEIHVHWHTGLLTWLSQHREELLDDLHEIAERFGGIAVASSIVDSFESCTNCPVTCCAERLVPQ